MPIFLFFILYILPVAILIRRHSDLHSSSGNAE